MGMWLRHNILVRRASKGLGKSNCLPCQSDIFSSKRLLFSNERYKRRFQKGGSEVPWGTRFYNPWEVVAKHSHT